MFDFLGHPSDKCPRYPDNDCSRSDIHPLYALYALYNHDEDETVDSMIQILNQTPNQTSIFVKAHVQIPHEIDDGLRWIIGVHNDFIANHVNDEDDFCTLEMGMNQFGYYIHASSYDHTDPTFISPTTYIDPEDPDLRILLAALALSGVEDSLGNFF